MGKNWRLAFKATDQLASLLTKAVNKAVNDLSSVSSHVTKNVSSPEQI